MTIVLSPQSPSWDCPERLRRSEAVSASVRLSRPLTVSERIRVWEASNEKWPSAAPVSLIALWIWEVANRESIERRI